MLTNIKIGQIWKLVDADKYYNTGTNDDIFIILSGQPPLKDGVEVWGIGVFWWSGKEMKGFPGWGGARQKNFTAKEINEIGEMVAYLPDMMSNKRELLNATR